MNVSEEIEKVTQALTKGDLELAIGELADIVEYCRAYHSFDEILTYFALLHVEYKEFDNSTRQGVLREEEITLRRNQLVLRTREIERSISRWISTSPNHISSPEKAFGAKPIILVLFRSSTLGVLEAVKQAIQDSVILDSWDIDAISFNGDIGFNSILPSIRKAHSVLFLLSQEDVEAIQRIDSSPSYQILPLILGGLLAGFPQENIYLVPPKGKDRSQIPDFMEEMFWGTHWVSSNGTPRVNQRLIRQLNQELKKSKQKKESPSPLSNKLISLKNDKWNDRQVVYNISVLDRSGNANIEKKTVLQVNNGIILYRIHQMISYSSPVTWKEMNLIAKDDFGNTLEVVNIKDDTNRKQFKINFNQPLKPGDQYTYSYSGFWPAMFLNGSYSFYLKNSAPNIIFNLIIPSHWGLLYLHALERAPNDMHTPKSLEAKEPELIQIEQRLYNKYEFTLQNPTLHHETQMAWKCELPGN